MLAFSFPSKFLAHTEAFRPMKKPREQSKPTKHFQSNSLGFLIGLNASVSARNFEIFFWTLQIRWRQLSWASIAVRENCLENSQVFLK
jgi:hypothetical protein